MSSTSEKSSTSSSLLSAQTLVIAGIVWAVMALLFFLLFSVPLSAEEGLPLWYSIGTYIFECGAYFGAALVCFRNWQSPHMVSGRNVWLGIGLGMLFYFIAGVLFGIWELYFGLDPGRVSCRCVLSGQLCGTDRGHGCSCNFQTAESRNLAVGFVSGNCSLRDCCSYMGCCT